MGAPVPCQRRHGRVRNGMTQRPSSLEAAFRERAGEEGILGAASSPEQLELLRGTDGKLPGNVFQLMRAEAAKGGPGRPAGSRNKRSDDLAKLIVHRHGDPVMAMAAMYAMPLDQLIELVLIADSTAEREDRLLKLIERAEGLIDTLMAVIKAGAGGETLGTKVDKVVTLLDRVFDAAKALKMKPGDLAIKALNVQLAAAKATAEYVHSKKPVEANLNVKSDGVLVMPGAPAGSTFDQSDALVRQAADGIANMLREGRIEPAQLADYRFEGGQFVEAEWNPVEDDAE